VAGQILQEIDSAPEGHQVVRAARAVSQMAGHARCLRFVKFSRQKVGKLAMYLVVPELGHVDAHGAPASLAVVGSYAAAGWAVRVGHGTPPPLALVFVVSVPAWIGQAIA
jgi:hypothetical protein